MHLKIITYVLQVFESFCLYNLRYKNLEKLWSSLKVQIWFHKNCECLIPGNHSFHSCIYNQHCAYIYVLSQEVHPYEIPISINVWFCRRHTSRVQREAKVLHVYHNHFREIQADVQGKEFSQHRGLRELAQAGPVWVSTVEISKAGGYYDYENIYIVWYYK